MEYILININAVKSSIAESILDDSILKEYAYGAKYKDSNL